MLAAMADMGASQFSIVGYVVGKLGLPESWGGTYIDVVMSILIALILTIVSLIAWRRIRNTERSLLPEESVTVTNMLEITVEAILKLMGDIMGPERAKRHLKLIGPLFIYILISNLIGVIPGLYPPTENINTNLACALVVFLYYNYCGIREQGLLNYLRHMAGPIIWLAPLLFAIEIVSHLVRPVSLSVRLLGNVVGDHMVLEIFSGLIPIFLPIIFMVLAIFISILQAFVFTLLSIIYIQMASTAGEG